MSVRVVYVAGKSKGPLLDAASDYLRRADRRYRAELVRLSPAPRKFKGDDAKVKADEAERLGKEKRGVCLALTVDGKALSSESFSTRIEDYLVRGGVTFFVGGATGLDEGFVRACDGEISLSSFTLPHRLAVLVLAEQIYRAGEIARGGPYHK